MSGYFEAKERASACDEVACVKTALGFNKKKSHTSNRTPPGRFEPSAMFEAIDSDNGKILKADCGFGLDDSKSSDALLLRCSDAEVGRENSPRLFARSFGKILPMSENTLPPRVSRWTQKLLDLSLRNRLLNVRDSKCVLG